METSLAAEIARRIERDGPISFADFMDAALYHPQYGYYTSGAVGIGRDEGDFTTAPHLTTLFARCVARLVRAADLALGQPDPFTLAEGGPGEGRLGRDLLDRLRGDAPDLYARLRYAPDEVSPALRARQGALWEPHRDRLAPWPPTQPFRGLYFSNELVDAFPVHRVTRREGRLLEIHVGWESGRFTEIALPLVQPRLLAYLAEAGTEVQEGGEVEVNLRAREWLARVAGVLKQGFVVTVDYGDEALRLPGRADGRGTVTAYRGHRTAEDLFDRPGQQDLTAHVDFTALRRAGETLGLVSAPLSKFRDFLFAHGILQEIEALESELSDSVEQLAARRAVAPLLFPGGGMGDSFKVLVQARDVSFADLPSVAAGTGVPAAPRAP